MPPAGRSGGKSWAPPPALPMSCFAVLRHPLGPGGRRPTSSSCISVARPSASGTHLPVAADVEWEVADSGEGGRLTVPPRGRAPYSEVFLTTRHRGVLRLYRDGGLI